MGIGGSKANVVIIGGGFTGLSAAYELARLGIGVTVLERDDEPDGDMADLPLISGFEMLLHTVHIGIHKVPQKTG